MASSTATVSRKQAAHSRKRKRRHIIWSDPENVLALVLSQYGLHAKAIEAKTGLKPSAIYYRNRKRGIRIKDWRDGKGPVVDRVLASCSCQHIKSMSNKEVQSLLQSVGIEEVM